MVLATSGSVASGQLVGVHTVDVQLALAVPGAVCYGVRHVLCCMRAEACLGRQQQSALGCCCCVVDHTSWQKGVACEWLMV
jgi:hypothetical protein